MRGFFHSRKPATSFNLRIRIHRPVRHNEGFERFGHTCRFSHMCVKTRQGLGRFSQCDRSACRYHLLAQANKKFFHTLSTLSHCSISTW